VSEEELEERSSGDRDMVAKVKSKVAQVTSNFHNMCMGYVL
jgi:hypothetical protein